MVNEFRAKSYLKTLDGREQQSHQFLVKVIKVDGIVKMAVGLEYMKVVLSCSIGRR